MQIELALEMALSSASNVQQQSSESTGTPGSVHFSLSPLQIWEWLLNYGMESAHFPLGDVGLSLPSEMCFCQLLVEQVRPPPTAWWFQLIFPG